MRYFRTTLAALLILSGLLVACGDDSNNDDDGTAGTTVATGTPGPMLVEQLPPEALLAVGPSGPAAFDGTVGDFLGRLPFTPLQPSVVPDNWSLLSAMVVPSASASEDGDPGATLVLGYAPADGTAGVTVTEQEQPLPDIAAAAVETVELGGAEGYIFGTGDRDTGILMFQVCDIAVTITSSVLDTEGLVTVGKSVTERCAAPAGR